MSNETKELQQAILEFLKKYRKEKRDFNSKEAQNELKEIAKKLTKQLESNYILRVEAFYPDAGLYDIFKFLKEKDRTCRMCEGYKTASGTEALRMDDDFFIKYLNKLFFLGFYEYEFEDSRKIIKIDNDGGLKIKKK